MSAAIRCCVHYLDFSAELDTYRQALALDEQARGAGAMLLPGSGGSVAMLGSLASHAAARAIVTETLRLEDGRLVVRGPEELRDFDFGKGLKSSFPVTLPDLLTIHRATGVSDVETFVHVAAGAFPAGAVAELPAGPSARERTANRYQAAVEVTDSDGTVVRSVLDTVNGYTITAMAAAEAARRVLAGEVQPGFSTPAALFGHGFAETIADTRITDLPPM